MFFNLFSNGRMAAASACLLVGLPIPTDNECIIKLYPDKVTIDNYNDKKNFKKLETYTLDVTKIECIVYEEVDKIERVTQSWLDWGLTMAAYGETAAYLSSKDAHYDKIKYGYLIIDYISEGELKTIVFYQNEKLYLEGCKNTAKKFRKLKPNSTKRASYSVLPEEKVEPKHKKGDIINL